MAATTRKVCGCPSRLLLSAAGNVRSYLHCNKQNHLSASAKARLLCVDVAVAASRRILNVTSIGQRLERGRLLHVHNARAFKSCEQFQTSNTTRLLSAPSVRPLCSSPLNSFLLPYKYHAWQRRTLFCSSVFGLRNVHSEQSESKTSAVPKQRADDYSSCSDLETRQGQIHDKSAHKNETQEKKENIRTIPNLLTTLRMASAPLLGYMVVSESFGLALGLFTFAGITDLLDGYIARNFPNQTSALGSALDPLADKLLVTILTITLTSVGLIPLPLTGLIVFRDASLIAGGFYIRYKSLPPPITLSRYFDISHATVSLTPTFISKVNTGLQLSLVAFSLAAPVFGFVDHIGLQILWWTTGATTFLSGADYFWSWKKYVKLLEKDQKEL